MTMAVKSKHEKAGAKSDGNFVRIGTHVISFDRIVSAELPPDGDENNTLTIKLTTGENFTLTGDDTDTALEALGKCCDVKGAKK